MTELSADLLQQLLTLIDGLRDESADFLDRTDDQQCWYNRGYANGMIDALLALGQSPEQLARQLDDPAQLASAVGLPWGKAYRHGEQMGRRETYEITGKTA